MTTRLTLGLTTGMEMSNPDADTQTEAGLDVCFDFGTYCVIDNETKTDTIRY